MKKKVFLTTGISTQFVPLPFFTRWTSMLIGKMKGYEETDLDFDLHIQLGSSVPAICRMHQVKSFLENTKCDYFVNIDCDQDWNENAISKMIELDKDIVSAPVTMKGGTYAPNIYEYDSEVKVLANRVGHLPEEPFQVKDGGVGFGMICIKREVLQILWKNKEADLFRVGKVNKWNNTYIGEDLSLCYWANELDFEIWVRPDIDTNHFVYKGCSIKDHYDWYDNNYESLSTIVNGEAK